MQLGGDLRTNEFHQVQVVDVLVMLTLGSLGRRGEDGLLEPGTILQPLRQADSAHRVIALVFGPAGTRQVTTHHAFNGEHLQFLDDHGSSGDLSGNIQTDEMVVDDAGQLVEPPQRQVRQDGSLPGNPRGQDVVVGADPVSGNHEEAARLIGEAIEATDLALSQQREFEVRSDHGGIMPRLWALTTQREP